MPAAKRKASGKQKQPDTKAKQSKQDGQKAVSHDLDIPLDESFQGRAPLIGLGLKDVELLILSLKFNFSFVLHLHCCS